jgi:hypothetical protein
MARINWTCPPSGGSEFLWFIVVYNLNCSVCLIHIELTLTSNKLANKMLTKSIQNKILKQTLLATSGGLILLALVLLPREGVHNMPLRLSLFPIVFVWRVAIDRDGKDKLNLSSLWRLWVSLVYPCLFNLNCSVCLIYIELTLLVPRLPAQVINQLTQLTHTHYG